MLIDTVLHPLDLSTVDIFKYWIKFHIRRKLIKNWYNNSKNYDTNRFVKTWYKKQFSKFSPDSSFNFIHDEMINYEDLRFWVAYEVFIFQRSTIKFLFVTSATLVRQSLKIFICFVF